MLSAVFFPVDNVPIGQHPYIIRLLKGVQDLQSSNKCPIGAFPKF